MAAGGEPVTGVVLVVDGVEVDLGRVGGGPAGLGLVSALARLQLAARRRGGAIRLHEPSDELRALLVLVGLDEVLGLPALPLEPARQAELGEQLGVEEVVDPGDPAV